MGSSQAEGSNTLRGKRLHREMERRVIPQYQQHFYEDAIINAYKVLEARLREATGQTADTGTRLVDLAFSPTTGNLNEPEAAKSDLEARHALIRGAFLAYRNPPAHRFTDPDADQAFDAIVLANRLLLMIEEAEWRRSGRRGAPPSARRRTDLTTGPVPVQLDADGDGEDELIVPTRQRNPSPDDPIRWSGPEPFEVYEFEVDGLRRVEVEAVSGGQELMWLLLELSLVDVDGDGRAELACAMDGGGPWSALLLYKYRDGRYEALRGVNPNTEEPTITHFMEAWVVDVDGDGLPEVVGEPWGFIPPEQLRMLLPYGTTPEGGGGGRVRYVWKWEPSLGYFAVVSRHLMYLGPRGLPAESWEEIHGRVGLPPRG